MERKLASIYYATPGYWKGHLAITKLALASRIDKEEVKKWLEKQALWQIYLPKPKYIPKHH